MDKTGIYSIYTAQSTFPYLFHLTRKASENYEITTGPQAVLRHSTLRRCTIVPVRWAGVRSEERAARL